MEAAIDGRDEIGKEENSSRRKARRIARRSALRNRG